MVMLKKMILKLIGRSYGELWVVYALSID